MNNRIIYKKASKCKKDECSDYAKICFCSILAAKKTTRFLFQIPEPNVLFWLLRTLLSYSV